MITSLQWYPPSVKPRPRPDGGAPICFISVQWTMRPKGMKPIKRREVFLAVYAFDNHFRMLHHVGDKVEKGLAIAEDVFDKVCAWAYQPAAPDLSEEDLLS